VAGVSTPGVVTVACLQLDGGDAATAERVRAAVAGIEDAAAAGAELVVLPELWPVGFHHFGHYLGAAEDLTGPTVSALAGAARRAGCWVYGGTLVERSGGGDHFNTAVLLDAAGRIRLTYRKAHLFGHRSRETELLTPGDALAVTETPFGMLGASTCFDLRFPELYRGLVSAGARVLVVTAAWPAARLEHWRILLRARAVENQAYVIGCGAAGSDRGVALAGHSTVVDPWGTVIAEAAAAPTTLLAPLEVRRPDAVRAEYPFLAARRGPLLPA
jgi:predicted amidohydrolase